MVGLSLYRDGLRHLNRNMILFIITAFFVGVSLQINGILYNLYLMNSGYDNAKKALPTLPIIGLLFCSGFYVA